jgi:AmmeMemoRadiSam system protein A
MSPRPENPTDTKINPAAIDAEFSREERALLLKVAHETIEASVNRRELVLPAVPAHLAEPRGAFTTLYLAGDLRGCVGYVLPVVSLLRTVAESARAAALDDMRFNAVTPEEAPHLEIVLSVLSPLAPILAERVEIGRHGLVVTLGLRRGLLLPQVPIEHGWDRETFLCQTCRKAGLPLDAWQHGAVLEAFTAEVFGDRDVF